MATTINKTAIIFGGSRGLGRNTAVNLARHGVGDTYDAQVLGYQRSHGGADANDHVHEEPIDARRCIAHLAVWTRAVQPGCPAVALTKCLN